MRESRPPGSVRGVPSNGYPYRDSHYFRYFRSSLDYGIPRAQLLQELFELGTLPAHPGGLLHEDPLAAGGLQDLALSLEILVLGGDKSVAKFHCVRVLPEDSYLHYLTGGFGQGAQPVLSAGDVGNAQTRAWS